MTYNPNKYYQAYLCAYNKIKYTVESSEKNFSKVKEGDCVALTHAGAYGMTLSSNYNTRPIIAEIMVSGSKLKVIRKRQTLKNLVNN